jgi:hypothetical protein
MRIWLGLHSSPPAAEVKVGVGVTDGAGVSLGPGVAPGEPEPGRTTMSTITTMTAMTPSSTSRRRRQ